MAKSTGVGTGSRFTSVEDAQHMSSQQLKVMVRRLIRAGMNSEQVKEWFVQELPLALRATSRGTRLG